MNTILVGPPTLTLTKQCFSATQTIYEDLQLVLAKDCDNTSVTHCIDTILSELKKIVSIEVAVIITRSDFLEWSTNMKFKIPAKDVFKLFKEVIESNFSVTRLRYNCRHLTSCGPDKTLLIKYL